MQTPIPHGLPPLDVQANLSRILATTALQWGLSRASVERPVRAAVARYATARRHTPARVSAQTVLGLTWGWCY